MENCIFINELLSNFTSNTNLFCIMTYNMHKEMSNLFGDLICKNHFKKYLNKKAFFSFTRLIEDIISDKQHDCS